MLWGPKRLKLNSTGQTGPAQADRRSFGFVFCRVSLKLIILINLITEDKYLGVTSILYFWHAMFLFIVSFIYHLLLFYNIEKIQI